LVNYKGIYFEDDNEKFQDPNTGAHFKHNDMCKRLLVAAEHRKVIEQ